MQPITKSQTLDILFGSYSLADDYGLLDVNPTLIEEDTFAVQTRDSENQETIHCRFEGAAIDGGYLTAFDAVTGDICRFRVLVYVDPVMLLN